MPDTLRLRRRPSRAPVVARSSGENARCRNKKAASSPLVDRAIQLRRPKRYFAAALGQSRHFVCPAQEDECSGNVSNLGTFGGYTAQFAAEAVKIAILGENAFFRFRTDAATE